MMTRFVIAVWLSILAARPSNIWGGDHVQMEVAKGGAMLEFDCATGTIGEPVPETDGTFSLKGTFTPERSGPSRDGASAIEATYSGAIKGDTLTLHLVLTGTDRREMDYVLLRGREGNVRKCR